MIIGQQVQAADDGEPGVAGTDCRYTVPSANVRIEDLVEQDAGSESQDLCKSSLLGGLGWTSLGEYPHVLAGCVNFQGW